MYWHEDDGNSEGTEDGNLRKEGNRKSTEEEDLKRHNCKYLCLNISTGFLMHDVETLYIPKIIYFICLFDFKRYGKIVKERENCLVKLLSSINHTNPQTYDDESLVSLQ